MFWCVSLQPPGRGTFPVTVTLPPATLPVTAQLGSSLAPCGIPQTDLLDPQVWDPHPCHWLIPPKPLSFLLPGVSECFQGHTEASKSKPCQSLPV